MSPLAPLTTTRLTLRPLHEADHAAVFRILSCPFTTANVSWRQATPEAAGTWLERRMADEAAHGVSMWAVEKESDLIGLCGFFPKGGDNLELGYVVHHLHQSQGYATEAASAAVRAACQAGFGVHATIRLANLASIKVSQRAGLRRTEETLAARPDLAVFRLHR